MNIRLWIIPGLDLLVAFGYVKSHVAVAVYIINES